MLARRCWEEIQVESATEVVAGSIPHQRSKILVTRTPAALLLRHNMDLDLVIDTQWDILLCAKH